MIIFIYSKRYWLSIYGSAMKIFLENMFLKMWVDLEKSAEEEQCGGSM